MQTIIEENKLKKVAFSFGILAIDLYNIDEVQ